MAYFNLVRIPLMLFPVTLREVIKTYVSLKRITNFLNAEELDEDCVSQTTRKSENAIEVNRCNFSWDKTDKLTLKNISFEVPKGSLTAIVGSVGSGKSSLLSAILGEMEKSAGTIAKEGTIAYVAQQAWIQNLSLKDNILFAQEYDDLKYNQIIDSCALRADLTMLVNGDATEIGENGINLSGGQKQRVSLARAVYHNADIYLLDDPLSAVDAHVGKHIFDHVIGKDGLLREKTRVWVTNNLSFLSQVDHILVLNSGEIFQHGKFQELMFKHSYLSELIHNDNIEIDGQEDCDTTIELKKNQLTPEKIEGNEAIGKLVEKEKSETGRVKFKTYLAYFKTLGYYFSAIFVLLVGAQESLHLAGNIWLSKWSDTNSNSNLDQDMESSIHFYLSRYVYIGLSEMVVKLFNDLAFFFKCATASKKVHENLLNNIMRSPMHFFDTNPTGRILNRFTSDLDTMDQMIPYEILDFTWCLIECIVVILLVCVTTPIFVAVVIPLLVLYYFIQRVYIASSRQLKRLYSVSKSPIFAHFAETTNGAQTIRAYKQEARFIKESQAKVNDNVKSIYLNLMSNRWLGMRLENIGNLFIFFASLFAVLSRDSLTAGEAGLSITSSLQIIGALVWVVRQACMLETDCVAIERILEYTKTEQEAPWEDPKDNWSSYSLTFTFCKLIARWPYCTCGETTNATN